MRWLMFCIFENPRYFRKSQVKYKMVALIIMIKLKQEIRGKRCRTCGDYVIQVPICIEKKIYFAVFKKLMG